MPDDARYEMALAVAIRLLHALDARPLMLRHERLATAVYSVLDTLGGLEIGGSSDSCRCPRCRCQFSPRARRTRLRNPGEELKDVSKPSADGCPNA
jgi:hypothetical protein